jgi:adenylate cyclase
VTSEPDDAPGPEEAHRLLRQIESSVVGSRATLNRVQVCEAAGFPLERATVLWRALGFPAAQDDDDQIFSQADVEALRLVAWLEETGVMQPEIQPNLVRGMGRSYAQLAEWEMAELVAAMTQRGHNGGTETEDVREVLDSLIPVLEDLQRYVWRRHLAHAAARVLLQPRGDETDAGRTMLVGFADIVGFTRRTREMGVTELDRLVETFEGRSADVVTERGGRVIKTIGDEILFVADDPVQGAHIALELVEVEAEAEGFPTLHVGLAYGEVLPRVGDVFGPTVNLASRLTSLARPGRVLVDREMHRVLGPLTDDFRVRRARTTAVRGYSRLESWTVGRPRPPRKERDERERPSGRSTGSRASRRGETQHGRGAT